MKWIIPLVVLAVLAVMGVYASNAAVVEEVHVPPMPARDLPPATAGETRTVVLAGGCFWCVEAYLEPLRGVEEAVSGYAGGSADDANYDMVSSGGTKHVEVVQVTYDPAVISYAQLLQVFFTLHDPLTGNGQKPDFGTQYRPAIFYANDDEKEVATAYIEQLNDSGFYDKPVETRVEPLDTFYPAEDYHQDFVKNNPNHPYVVQWSKPKTQKLQRAFPQLLGDGERVQKTDAEWKKELTSAQYNVLREEGTERPFSSPLNNEKRTGTFVCAADGYPLFASATKFDSGTGWPSFYEPIAPGHVVEKTDSSMGMTRTEIECPKCGGHLGHVFNDGPAPTGLRYCINGVALEFEPAD